MTLPWRRLLAVGYWIHMTFPWRRLLGVGFLVGFFFFNFVLACSFRRKLDPNSIIAREEVQLRQTSSQILVVLLLYRVVQKKTDTFYFVIISTNVAVFPRFVLPVVGHRYKFLL